MRNNSKVDEASKSKDDQQVSLTSTVREIRHVADANQLRLQHLELAVANLTSICCAIRHDMYSLGSSSNQGLFRKVQAEVSEMKRPSFTRSSSPSLDKDDVLGAQMQQLVEQATALGILKDSKTSPIKLTENVKADSKILTRPAPKKVQATTNKKSSTKQLVQRMESTTEKKMSMTLATINNLGATRSKAEKGPPASSAGNNFKATATAKVSLKSTVKRTKTTISKVYVDQPTRSKGKETAIKNLKQIQGKDSIKLTIKARQGHIEGHTASKYHAPTKPNSLPGATKSDLKPRRKWSTPEEITLKK